jgi:hypothetical protein
MFFFDSGKEKIFAESGVFFENDFQVNIFA